MSHPGERRSLARAVDPLEWPRGFEEPGWIGGGDRARVWGAGWSARVAGVKLADCPYRETTVYGEVWVAGWMEARGA